MVTLAIWSFWISVATLAYVYLGYPLIVFMISRFWSRPTKKAPITPRVSMIIAAYNEEEVIGKKIDNTLSLDYPVEELEIIVASDGSSDGTNQIVESYGDRVKLMALARMGKTAAQNHAAAAATGEILVFSDASTIYDRGALKALVASYADPSVGSVGGDVAYLRQEDATAGRGRELYWSYEARLRRWESAIYSVIGATGCIYSIRRDLYTPLPPDAISDFVQPAIALLRGFRSVVEDGARAFEIAESKRLSEELERRARVVLRGLRGTSYMREMLNPVKHPWLCFELVSHRLLRWAVPFFLILLFLANLQLISTPGYYRLFILQSAVYVGALVALVCEVLRVRAPGLFVPLYFCLINLAPLVALWSLLKGEKKIVWDTGSQG